MVVGARVGVPLPRSTASLVMSSSNLIRFAFKVAGLVIVRVITSLCYCNHDALHHNSGNIIDAVDSSIANNSISLPFFH